MSDTDFATLMEPVARHLWGEPNAKLSSKVCLRWGSQGSKSLELNGDGYWHDFQTGESGGVIKLVARETGFDKDGAVEWLKTEGFLEENRPRPAQEVREAEGPPQEEFPLDEEPAGEWIPVKGYRYTSSDGDPLYEVIRKHFKLPDGTFAIDPKTGNPKKTFAQRHKGPDGSYIHNLKGVTHTIYRHPEVEQALADGRPVALCEGEKDVETLETLGWTATTNSGGAGNWRPDLAEIFRNADVVIMVDNDDVGRAAGETRAKSLRGIAARVRVLDFSEHVPNFPEKRDVTDWVEMGGTPDQLSAIIGRLPDWRPSRPISKFNGLSLAGVGKQASRHSWLVHDMIELGGTVSLAGFTQSGKSFLMVDLAFCIGTGTQFWGRDVKQGLVVYQVGEGENGFFKRIEGYRQDRGITDDNVPIEFLPRKINLFVDDKDTNDLIAECKDLEEFHKIKLRLVVIDTFNKATRGSNEISGQDNGKINERVERIARECDCTVAVVDHLSAQGRLRGHTSKSDDMTNVVKVTVLDKTDRNGRAIRKFTIDKNKDGENGISVPFVLRQIVTGFDEVGRPITTCVVDAPDGDVAEEATRRPMSLGAAILLRIVRDTAEIEGEKAPIELVQVPPGQNVAKWTAVLDRARKKWTLTQTDPVKRETELMKIIKDAGNRLMLAGYLDRDNERGLIWFTGKSDRPPRRVDAKPLERPPLSPGMREAQIDGVPF